MWLDLTSSVEELETTIKNVFLGEDNADLLALKKIVIMGETVCEVRRGETRQREPKGERRPRLQSNRQLPPLQQPIIDL